MKTLLSKDITLEDLCRSNLANTRNHDANPNNDIDNTPDQHQKENLGRLARMILQYLIDELQIKLVISSGFRCAALNAAVGGASNSQHLFGEAADINAVGLTNVDLFNRIKALPSTFMFGQCILENLDGRKWVHISTGTKRQFLKTDGRDEHGKVRYVAA